jgi:hypothetical protein
VVAFNAIPRLNWLMMKREKSRYSYTTSSSVPLEEDKKALLLLHQQARDESSRTTKILATTS